jgi:hypothetical protein
MMYHGELLRRLQRLESSSRLAWATDINKFNKIDVSHTQNKTIAHPSERCANVRVEQLPAGSEVSVY